jgi:hypothetical protein
VANATRAIINFLLRLLLSVRRLVERSIPRSTNRHRRFSRFLLAGLRRKPYPISSAGKGDDDLP